MKEKIAELEQARKNTKIKRKIRANKEQILSAKEIETENFFLILPYCNTDNMNVFMKELSKEYPQDTILLVCDGASWHKSVNPVIPV